MYSTSQTATNGASGASAVNRVSNIIVYSWRGAPLGPAWINQRRTEERQTQATAGSKKVATSFLPVVSEGLCTKQHTLLRIFGESLCGKPACVGLWLCRASVRKGIWIVASFSDPHFSCGVVLAPLIISSLISLKTFWLL